MSRAPTNSIALSLMFFGATPGLDAGAYYRLVLDAARYCDAHGFDSLWLPERHFTALGGFSPNPALLQAAVATQTQRLGLRAGSVVATLKDPLLIAEEWATVDQLSGGRCGFAMASGWNPDDFVLAPEAFGERQRVLEQRVEQVRTLWQGGRLARSNGLGKAVEIGTFPRPQQASLPLWITAARALQTFELAGNLGANVLTHLLDQGVDELATKIAAYRAARAAAGYDPVSGRVTVMVHSHVGDSPQNAVCDARTPFCRFLGDNLGLLRGLAAARGHDFDIAPLSAAERDELTGFLFDRFRQSRALIGDVGECVELVTHLDAVGVDEIAALVDFGPAPEHVLASLPRLQEVFARAVAVTGPAPVAATAPDASRIGPLAWRGPHPQAQVLDTLVAALAQRAPSHAQVGCEGITLPDVMDGPLWARVSGSLSSAAATPLQVAFEDEAGHVVGGIQRMVFEAAPSAFSLAPGLPHYQRRWQPLVAAGTPVSVCLWSLSSTLAGTPVASDHDERDLVLQVDAARVESVATFAQLLAHFDSCALAGMAALSGPARLWLAVHAEAADPMQALWLESLRGHARARIAEWEMGPRWGGTLELAPALPSAALEQTLGACRSAACWGADLRLDAQGVLAERVLDSAAVAPLAPGGLAVGSHLVTGANGDLGRECARALVAAGARELVLVSRSIDPTGIWAHELAEEFGMQVRLHCVPADVASVASLQALRAHLAQMGTQPLKGIIHAAGAVDQGVSDLTMLNAKVQALLALEQVFPRRELDYLLLFSSWAGSVGEIGMKLGTYAAANAAFDGYAEACAHPPTAGRCRVVSVGWGDWADSRVRQRARVSGKALLPELWCLSRAQGRYAIAHALSEGRGHVLATPVPWRDFLDLFPTTANERLLSLVAGRAAARSAAPAAAQTTRAELEAIVRRLLRHPVADAQLHDTGLAALGFDSIMALDLRGHIHRKFGVLLPISRILANPTPAMLLRDIVSDGGCEDPANKEKGLMEMDL